MASDLARAILRVKSAFLEVAGTRLTAGEMARLVDVEPSLCVSAMEALEQQGFLRRGPDGTFTTAECR